MWQWMLAHGALLQIVFSAVTALIWLVYLQLLLSSTRRQRRPMILIHRGAGDDENARCFLSNMGAEPIYLMSLIAELETDDGPRSAVITDRSEWREKDLENPASATNQGPLESGQFIDVGSFRDLMDRAECVVPGTADTCRSLTLTAVATYGHSARLAGARRRFLIGQHADRLVIHPTAISTEQLSSFPARRRLARRLAEDLHAEGRAMGFET